MPTDFGSRLRQARERRGLSLRQIERNPWEGLSNLFPVGSIIDGRVRNLTEFGAFVEITEEIDGLVHVSDMSWTKRIKHPSEVLKKGDTVRARITNIDVDNQRVSLSIKEFLPNEWQEFVENNRVGDIVTGRVVNVTDFGLFIDIFDGLEGLAHISEIGLTIRGVSQPSDEEIAELESSAAKAIEPVETSETAEIPEPAESDGEPS